MPSVSLKQWTGDRVFRVNEVDRQCQTSQSAVPPNAHLAEENLRGLILLLSAHFQGFCRDLYTESSQIISSRVDPSLEMIVQHQFTMNCSLGYGNPNLDNIKKDFNRFGFELDMVAADPANHVRLAHLKELNRWRNIAAHHGNVPPSGLPALTTVQDWLASCNGLACSLDSIMYNQLHVILRHGPWVP